MISKMNKLTKDDLQHGDVLLFTPHKGDIIAQAIAFLSNGKVHHAALCYYEDISKNDKCVIECLIGQGIVINYLKEKEERTFPVYVARLNKEVCLDPVLSIAKKYQEQKNHYPIPNIVLLAVLLLVKKFPMATLMQKAFYDFMCLISALLMDYIRHHGNEASMICSQFVAQCFSDVNDERYELHFKKLVIFDTINNCYSANNISEICLLDLFNNHNKGNFKNKEIFAKWNDDASIQKCYSEFINCLTNSNCLKEQITEDVCMSCLEELKNSLDVFFNTCFKMDFSLENINKLRNYLVTPQDLYENTPSLTIIGSLDYKDA